MPEIALTADFLERFALRFGARPAEWHSDVPPRSRERVWRGVADGRCRSWSARARRSSCRSRNLGLIVVDEEHDLAYKQEEGAVYNARDMAVVRAHLAGFPVVLVLGDAVDRNAASMPTPAATRASCFPTATSRRRCPRSRPSISASDQPERGRFLVAAAGRRRRGRPRRETAGAPVPQPSRLRAADALPHLRPPLPVPELLDVAGRASLPRRAPLPPLRPHGTKPTHLPDLRSDGEPDAGRAGHRAAAGRGRRRAFPTRAPSRCRAISSAACSACGRNSLAIAKGEVDIVIGTQLVAKGHNFPAADARRRGRCRSRPRPRRPSRRGAHLPVAQPGDRPRRARGRREPTPSCRRARRSIR